MCLDGVFYLVGVLFGSVLAHLESFAQLLKSIGLSLLLNKCAVFSAIFPLNNFSAHEFPSPRTALTDTVLLCRYGRGSPEALWSLGDFCCSVFFLTAHSLHPLQCAAELIS